jgi:hypothetical protein
MISFKGFVTAIQSAILDANDTLMANNMELLDQYFVKKEGSDFLYRPRVITIQFPHQTAKGVELVDVQVPVITLVPITMTKIEKVKLTSHFDLELVDNEVKMSFRSKGWFRNLGWFGKKRSATNSGPSGQMEITITPDDGPEGIKMLVDGFENALRAQIPQ